MKKEGLLTQNSQLCFTPQQLQQLNVYFSDMEMCQDLKQNQTISCVEEEIDKLIQYLSYVIGNIEPRFASEFLVHLESTNNCFSYLIRLDSLSVPSFYSDQNGITKLSITFENDEIPHGFAKIKLDEEFLDRDEIQTKYVELLRKVTTSGLGFKKFSSTLSEYDVPGKILDAETLYHILNIPPEERTFYVKSKEYQKLNSFDLNKFRIEVIESDYLVKLRIGFLSSNTVLDKDVDVILILGIGVQGWPSNSDYPYRIPLINADVLLHYQISRMGFFLTTTHSMALDNKNRSMLWQFFFPVADCIMANHYSESSCILRITNIVYSVILNLRKSMRGGHTVGKFIIKILTWFRLEKLNNLNDWTSDQLSYHIISILDELINCLRQQKCRSYFFKNHDALANSFRSIFTRSSMSDYKEDADIIETFLCRIYTLSSSELIGHQMISGERRQKCYIKYESIIKEKWFAVLNNMKKNQKQNGREIVFIPKQIEYITFLFRALLITQSASIPANNENVHLNVNVDFARCILKWTPDHSSISFEDACFIISSLFKQAKQHFLIQKSQDKNMTQPSSDSDQLILKNKTDEEYWTMMQFILSEVRKNGFQTFKNDTQMTTFILETLYKSIVISKVLKKILLPYLQSFFIRTLENCWYLEEWKYRNYNEELIALRIFSRLVSEKSIICKNGLFNALEKKWDWARDMLNLCITMKSDCELLFTSLDAEVTRQCLIFFDDELEQIFKQQSNPRIRRFQNTINELCEILKIEEKLELFSEDISVHFRLRNESPVTQIINRNRRKGIFPGLGNIVFSLAVLGKFTILQEITQILPEEKRHYALENIQKTIKEKQRADRIRGKLKNQDQVYRVLPEYTENIFYQYKKGSEENKTFYMCKENSKLSLGDRLFKTCSNSSTFSTKYMKSTSGISCHSFAYYDAPVTYFLGDSKWEWYSTSSQPHVYLSSDQQLSLLTCSSTSGTFTSNKNSKKPSSKQT